jgi:hypothetical protein
MLADAQIARWQSRYGRDPTDQQRSWLENKIRTDIAMIGTKLNAQVIIKNLQNMHEKSLPPTGARARLELEYQDWARLQGRTLELRILLPSGPLDIQWEDPWVTRSSLFLVSGTQELPTKFRGVPRSGHIRVAKVGFGTKPASWILVWLRAHGSFPGFVHETPRRGRQKRNARSRGLCAV